MRTKAVISILSLLSIFVLFLGGCSKDDDPKEEQTEATCGVSGVIDESVVGTWSGEIYFNSNNTAYSQSHTFRANGTVIASGTEVPDMNGCWRVSGDNIRYVGTLRYNGISVTTTFMGRIVTPDSIHGTYSADNDESGTIWMTR